MKKPRFVSFDLDGTLVDYSFANAVWLEGIPRLYAEEKDVNADMAKISVKEEYDKVGMKRLEWYDINYWLNRFRLTPKNWTMLLREYKHLIKPYPETSEILQTLRDANYTLIVISNAAREFLDAELEEPNIASYFKHAFSATSDFHQVKKTADLYQKILNILDSQPSDVVHVGDDWQFDYIASREAGIKSFFLDRKEQKSGNHIVKNLTELVSRIQQTSLS